MLLNNKQLRHPFLFFFFFFYQLYIETYYNLVYYFLKKLRFAPWQVKVHLRLIGSSTGRIVRVFGLFHLRKLKSEKLPYHWSKNHKPYS